MFVGAALSTAALAGQLWLVRMVRVAFEQTARDPSHPVKLPEPDTLLDIMVILAIPGVLSVLAGFFLSMARIRRDAERAGLTGFSYGMGWTVGSFFIPLFNLYRPWVGLGEIRRSVFVSLESGQIGRKWNRFGDLSVATIMLGVTLLALTVADIAYNTLAPVGGFEIRSLDQFYVLINAMRVHALINMALIGAMVGAFIIYVETLLVPAGRLTAPAERGALNEA